MAVEGGAAGLDLLAEALADDDVMPADLAAELAGKRRLDLPQRLQRYSGTRSPSCQTQGIFRYWRHASRPKPAEADEVAGIHHVGPEFVEGAEQCVDVVGVDEARLGVETRWCDGVALLEVIMVPDVRQSQGPADVRARAAPASAGRSSGPRPRGPRRRRASTTWAQASS